MTLNILIIDDDAADRMTVKSELARFGSVAVTEAEDGREGLALMKDNTFDGVFLDYRLPDMDGTAVLKKIYDPRTDMMPFPIVMLTGQGSEAVMVEAFRFGAHDYVPKDSISSDTLCIALIKAREMHELKQSRNLAEERLIQSQKMEALGQLTGGVAHDFNNLLTIIFGNTRLLDRKLEREEVDFEDYRKKVDAIRKTAKRGADLVKHMMVFSRQRSLSPETVSMNDLVREMEDLLQRSLGETVALETAFADDLWAVDIDPVMLEHVLINMGVNARDAMLDGGTLTIETENITVEAGDRTHDADIPPGNYATISVSDTGMGMPENVKKKIFDPFFTTKDVGQGTGLGLSMAYGFIRDSGGFIRVDSEKDGGTCFLIYFPKSEAQEQRTAAEQTEQEAPEGGTETILLVEDEEDIRFLTTSLLEEHGYTVIGAKDGPNALGVLMDREKTIDLLFTDIAMPNEMSGVQLAAKAEVLRPEIKLLFTTGYAGGSIPDIHLARRYTVIDKPYQADVLLRTLRKILDASEAEAA